MREIEIPVPRVPKVLSIKIDTAIDRKLDSLAKKLGFESKSSLLRFIICSVLSDLGELEPGEEPLCYTGLRLRKGAYEDNPELLIAIANVVATLRGLSTEEAAETIYSDVETLRAIAEA